VKNPSLAVIVLLSSLACSCVTTTGFKVAISPPGIEIPVSGSAHYVDGLGDIVSPDSYDVIEPFAFTKTVIGPIGRSDYSATLDLGPDLSALRDRNGADAIVNLRIKPETYDSGHSESLNLLGAASTTCALLGAVLFLGTKEFVEEESDDIWNPGWHTVPNEYYERDRKVGMTLMGIGLGGSGLYIYSISTGKAAWTISFSGDAVKVKVDAP